MKKGVISFFVLMAVLCLTACSPKVITIPEVHTEYISKTDTFISLENVFVHDSVLVQMKGDTIYVDRWHTKYRDRDVLKVVTDTLIRHDSIPEPYPVEKDISLREKVGYGFWGFAIGFFFTLILITFVILLRFRKC